jgi:hypothetical protein
VTAFLGLLVSLIAALLLWHRPDELQAAWAVLAGLTGWLLGAWARRARTSNRARLVGLAAMLLGGGVAAALLGSAVFLVMRAFFTNGPGTGL